MNLIFHRICYDIFISYIWSFTPEPNYGNICSSEGCSQRMEQTSFKWIEMALSQKMGFHIILDLQKETRSLFVGSGKYFFIFLVYCLFVIIEITVNFSSLDNIQ